MQYDYVDRLAHGISHLLCPTGVAIGGSLLVTAVQPSPQAWRCAGVYLALAVFVPLLIFLWWRFTGVVSDS